MDIQGLTSEQRDAVVNAAFLWPAYQQLNLMPDDIINFFVQSLRGARRRGENVAALLQATRAVLPLLTAGSAATRESLASWLRAAPETWQASVLIAAADKDTAAVDSLIGELRALNPASIRGLRPLLNGTEIAELLKLPRGPQIGVAAQALMRWQLANPTAGRQDAVTWLQQRRFYSSSSSSSSRQFASSTASTAPPGRAHHTDRLVESDVSDDPGALFSRWYAEAALNSPPPIEANTMALCTASKTGQPSSRTVLLREFDQDSVAFTFFGNGHTRKGSEMAENPRASLLFYWPALGRQVRVEGTVERTSAEESAAVFAVRPRDFQVGSCASPDTGKRLGTARTPGLTYNSHNSDCRFFTDSRELLEASARAVSERVKDTDVLDAPPHWAGWRVRADNLEFLQMHSGLLHDRFAFRRTGDRSWSRERIAP